MPEVRFAKGKLLWDEGSACDVTASWREVE
jgi:hypothetical protein